MLCSLGADPFYFYLANILLHAVNSFLIYLFCTKWFAADGRKQWYSVIAGLIFLTYPSILTPRIQLLSLINKEVTA